MANGGTHETVGRAVKHSTRKFLGHTLVLQLPPLSCRGGPHRGAGNPASTHVLPAPCRQPRKAWAGGINKGSLERVPDFIQVDGRRLLDAVQLAAPGHMSLLTFTSKMPAPMGKKIMRACKVICPRMRTRQTARSGLRLTASTRTNCSSCVPSAKRKKPATGLVCRCVQHEAQDLGRQGLHFVLAVPHVLHDHQPHWHHRGVVVPAAGGCAFGATALVLWRSR